MEVQNCIINLLNCWIGYHDVPPYLYRTGRRWPSVRRGRRSSTSSTTSLWGTTWWRRWGRTRETLTTLWMQRTSRRKENLHHPPQASCYQQVPLPATCYLQTAGPFTRYLLAAGLSIRYQQVPLPVVPFTCYLLPQSAYTVQCAQSSINSQVEKLPYKFWRFIKEFHFK